MKENMYYATGRRKESVARVWLKPGKGSILINGKDHREYLDTAVARSMAAVPFKVVGKVKDFDANINVCGGGKVSQAGAIKLGISRALVSFDESFKSALRKHDLLTVDARVKERKKYGQRGARRKFQFVKR